MSNFTRNLDELLYLTKQKVNIVRYLIKNYRENIHYIIEQDKSKNTLKHGGHNKIIFLLTDSTYELLKNSYNLRNRYIVDINDNIISMLKFKKSLLDWYNVALLIPVVRIIAKFLFRIFRVFYRLNFSYSYYRFD